MISVGIITVSDRSSKGQRDDLSGPEIRRWAQEKGYSVTDESIVPDEIDAIAGKLVEYSDRGIHLILTTGGTGFAPRDVTPDATMRVVERIAPGFAEAMRQKSLEITPSRDAVSCRVGHTEAEYYNQPSRQPERRTGESFFH